MFTFPRSTAKTTWQGQGVLIGGTIPWFGGDGLGVCFGISSVWVKNGAPYDFNAMIKEQRNVQSVTATQSLLSQTLIADNVLFAMGTSAESLDLATKAERKYDGGTASHVILDILAGNTAAHFVIGFYFKGGAMGSGAHAIGVSFDSPQTGMIMDPNYGIAKYDSRSSLCNDLHALLATYCSPGGSITESYLLEFENDDGFGDFVGS